MNFNYNHGHSLNEFSKVMDICDGYLQRQPQFRIFIVQSDGEMDYDAIDEFDANKLNDEKNIKLIQSYLNGEHDEQWIDDNEGNWGSIMLYYDGWDEYHREIFESVAELVNFDEIREKRKKCAMDYLRKVLPKYVRHYLYKPKGIMAKKAKEDFENKI